MKSDTIITLMEQIDKAEERYPIFCGYIGFKHEIDNFEDVRTGARTPTRAYNMKKYLLDVAVTALRYYEQLEYDNNE